MKTNNNTEPAVLPRPTTKPETNPGTSDPKTNPGKDKDPWKVPNPNLDPTPKA